MATLADNVAQVRLDFQTIRQSLLNKNLLVPLGTPTNQYSTLIDSLITYNKQDFQHWLDYGGIDYTLYNSLAEVLASADYDNLLAIEASAAYAAYLSTEIANEIKNNSIYLKKALLSNYGYMFINSSLNFDEAIDDLIEENPKVDATNYQGIVTWDADRCTDPSLYSPPYPQDMGYYGYMAFDNKLDSDDMHVLYRDRHIWSALGTNHWVQYKYSEPKYLYSVYIYSIRDNAPLAVKIEGSNDGEYFTLIKEQNLDGIVGNNHYNKIICCNPNTYQYYRFTINDSLYAGSCNVGEIRLFTFK